MYSSVKFFEPTMTVGPAVGAADAVIAEMSAAVRAASIPTIITERHFFLLITSFLPVVVHWSSRCGLFTHVRGFSMAQATRGEQALQCRKQEKRRGCQERDH